MTPMIDMVFLLLVFFMTVSTLASADKQVKLDLPASSQSEVPDDLSGRGTISVDARGRIHIGAKELGLDAMRATMKEALEENPQLRIHLRADELTPYKEIKRVLKACAQVGAYEVIYATYQAR